MAFIIMSDMTFPVTSHGQYLGFPDTTINGDPNNHRLIVNLSDESAFAVKWAIQNYLRPGDAVILLHVRPTNRLYGADWVATDVSIPRLPKSQDSQGLSGGRGGHSDSLSAEARPPEKPRLNNYSYNSNQYYVGTFEAQ
ncbi:hypothetical protein ACFX2I_009210 [Malus domestica]